MQSRIDDRILVPSVNVGLLREPAQYVLSRYIKHCQFDSPLNSILWTENGNKVITGSYSGRVSLWNARCFEFDASIENHKLAIRSMCWNRSKTLMLSGGDEGRVVVWSRYMKSDESNQHVITQRPLYNLAFSPAHDEAFTACAGDKFVCTWNLETQEQAAQCDTQTHEIHTSAWNPVDVGQLVVGMVNGSVAQWDPRVSRVVHVRRVHRENVSAISWNDAGTHYISASRDQTLKLWDRRHELPLQVFQDTRAAHDGGDYTVCVAWNPQSAHVFASGSNEGTVTYWCCGSDANCGTTRHTSFVPSTLSRAPTPPGARCLLYDCKSETKEELVAPTGGCDTSDVKGDRAKEGTNDIRGDESRVTRAVEREIKHPSSASRRRVPTSGKIGEMLAAHCGRVSDLAFHPEGHVLCSVGGDATLKFWGGCYPDADFENCFEAHQLPPARQTELAPSEALVDSTDDSVIPRPASTGTHAAQALSDDAPFFS